MKIRFLLVLALFLTTSAFAEVHYSAVFGQSCFLCHANPTGRGMRSLYGSQFFAPNYLSYKAIEFEDIEKIKPQLSESVTIGVDFRTIWMTQSPQSEVDSNRGGLSAPISTNTGQVTQMEGYFYLTFQPHDLFYAYLSRGVSDADGRMEAYGIATVLPFHGFVKAGQFQENYGWAFSDHTSFVRTGLFSGYDGAEMSPPTPMHYGVGGEIGFRPLWFDVTGSFTNSQEPNPQQFDHQKRFFARAQALKSFEEIGFQIGGGGSYMHAPKLKTNFGQYGFPDDKPKTEAWGGFGSLGWQGLHNIFGLSNGFGFLTTAALFEYDRKNYRSPTNMELLTGSYATGQLNTMLYHGVWVNGQYDWLDNGDGREAERTSIGVQFFPLPWIDINPKYRLYSSADRARNTQHAELLVHFQF